jgi:hypothetical protein
MTDIVKETQPTGKAPGQAVLSPEARDAELSTARALIKALWQAEWTAANPGASAQDRMATWKAVRAERLQSQMKPIRAALRILTKQGITLTATSPSVQD